MPADITSLVGYFEGLQEGCLYGWVYRPGAPDDTVQLVMCVDDLAPVEVVANLFRPDLEAAGIGNGCHGFRTPAPPELIDGGSHVVAFIDASDGSLALASPHRVMIADPAQASTKRGVLDALDGTALRGWACDTAFPDECATLELLRDGEIVREFQTGLYRQDLHDMGLGSGHHGFAVNIPDACAQVAPCSLHIRFRDGHIGLQRSPIGYFNPGDVLGMIARLEKRIDAQEDRLMYAEYLMQQRRSSPPQ